MRSELLAPENPRWMELLSGMQHDVYHLPEYLQFAVRWDEQGRPMAFAAEEGEHRFFVPLIVRPIPSPVSDEDGPVFDASCPRFYPGPLLHVGPGPGADTFLERAISAFTETLRNEGIVSAFIRLHPLLSPSPEQLAPWGVIVGHGESTSIDLTLSDAEQWRRTDHGHRRGINKAKRLGFLARVDASWDRFDEFVDAYRRTMERVGAVPFWHLPTGYFADLREVLGERLYLCVVELGDELATASLLTETDGIVEYHLSGTVDAFLWASPSKLLIDYARSWARDRGNRTFHLTGSLGPGDSLSQFKAGFSRDQHPVASWRLITDGGRYAALTRAWERRHGQPADPPDGFFPAYRKPGRILSGAADPRRR